MELLFRLTTGRNLLFDPLAAFLFLPAVHDYLAGIQAHSGERHEKQRVLRKGRGRAKHERVKKVGKNGAENCGQNDLPASKDGPDQQQGEYVKKAEIVYGIQPIRNGNDRNEKAGAGQHCARIFLQGK